MTITGSPASMAARIAAAIRPAGVSRPGASGVAGTRGAPDATSRAPSLRRTRPASAGSAAIISVIHHGGPSRCSGWGRKAHGSGGPDSGASGSGWLGTSGSNGLGGSMTPMIGSARGGAEDAGREPAAGTRWSMQVGVMIPQGWKGEYDRWNPVAAWDNAVATARQAEELGFESIWVFDHFTTVPQPTDEITFESFTMLGALAAATERVRLGHMVVCTGFRNPALTAKMASTLDVISGGRFELGIGAGWKEDEWVAYGYGFPPLRERLAALGDHLEVIRRMLGPGRATYDGRFARVEGAINVPKGVQQPRIPIIVGGNGQNVTFRLAARHAEELNLVFLDPAEVAENLPVVRQRCEEEGRDPATLRISLYCSDRDVRPVGQARVDRIGEFAALGLDRLVAFPSRWDTSEAGLARFAEDVRAAGVGLAVPVVAA